MQKFREAHNIWEIWELIKNSRPEHCQVWQVINGQRQVYFLDEINFEVVEKSLFVRIKDYDGKLRLDEFVYFHLDNRETIFKVGLKKINQDILTLNFPSVVKTEELRSIPRVSFKTEQEKYVFLNLMEKNNLGQERKLKCRLLDLSTQGMAILVTNSNKKLFLNADSIEISHICDQKLTQPIAMELKNNKSHQIRENGKIVNANRFGFSLAMELELDQLLSDLD